MSQRHEVFTDYIYYIYILDNYDNRERVYLVGVSAVNDSTQLLDSIQQQVSLFDGRLRGNTDHMHVT